MLRNNFYHYKKQMMELKMKVIGNNSVSQTKAERNPDNTVKTTTADLSRVSCRDDQSNILQFTTDYENGKTFVLGKEVSVTIQ
jgi:hypothetical protein